MQSVVAVPPPTPSVALAFVLSLAACATTDEQPDVFEFEPGLFVPLRATVGKAVLPNGDYVARPLDTSGYKAIAQRFVDAGLDVRPGETGAIFDWPLEGSRAVLNRAGTPIILGAEVYEHTGLDVIRLNDAEDARVHAPTGGTALITDWAGEPYFPYGDYSTVISIWDPVTHHVLQLMHVRPDPALPIGDFFEVDRGQVVGELADFGIPRGRHTHVNVVDAERFLLVDPIDVMPGYPDTTPPAIGEAYLLDESGARANRFTSGAFDLVVTGFDRDDQSPRNLEVSRIAYTVTDQDGRVLAAVEPCRLSDAFAALVDDWSTASTTIRLVDFGNAGSQVGGFWPNSDLGNPERLFRYALTNLRSQGGACSLVDTDRQGQLELGDDVKALTATVEMWDGRGNLATSQFAWQRRTKAAVVAAEPATELKMLR